MTGGCPVCGAEHGLRLTVRAGTPVFQNGVFASAAAARACARGPVEFRRCERCGFAWNAAFDPSIIDYAEGYENAQQHSAAFRDHLDQRIARIVAALPGEPVEVLELGCGQGGFLAEIAAALGPRLRRAVGFDPAWRGVPVEGLELHGAYFGAGTAAAHRLRPDIVVSRHVIEHIPDPVGFLAALRAGVGEGTRLFLETPTNDWILRGRVHHDIFYEHCSLFTPGSIAIALERAGFQAERVETCFGGQYLWAEAVAARPVAAEGFEAAEAEYVARWRAEIAAAGGPVWLWGAGAKGATFALLTDPDGTALAGLVDINPAKQGTHVAATGHAIRPPGALAEGAARPALVLVMNPLYAPEIAEQLAAMGLAPRILTVE